MTTDLGTTNVLLGIIAAVSLLEGLMIVGLFVGAFLVYRRVLKVLDGVEQRQVAPAVARVNAILDDVRDVTSTVRKRIGHIEALLDWGIRLLGGGRRPS